MLAEQWDRENNFKFTPIDAEMQYEKFGMKEFNVFRDPNDRRIRAAWLWFTLCWLTTNSKKK